MITELTKARQKALKEFGLDLPDLNFVQRDALFSTGQAVQIHEVDRTPLVFDPDLGPGDIRERCFASRGIDVGGRSGTGANGQMTWRLSDFICEVGRLSISATTSFVATAESSSAVIMTTRTVSTGDDLVLEVFSWAANGDPAPNVRFTWRCWVESQIIIG